MKLPARFVTALGATINRYLRLDPDAMSRMTQLDVQCIAIELRGLDLTLYALPISTGIQVTDQYEGTPDTTITGTPLGLAQLGLGQQQEKSLFSGAVEISGNVESGQAFQAILNDIDIDWEEHLSQLTGDLVAHRLGNAVRTASNLFRQSRSGMRQNVQEYLQEEARLLPARIEIENFCTDVTQLAIDGDRLDIRVRRLRGKTATTGEQT